MSYQLGLTRELWANEVAQYLPLKDWSSLTKTSKAAANLVPRDLLKREETQKRIVAIQIDGRNLIRLYNRAYPQWISFQPLTQIMEDLNSVDKTRCLSALKKYRSVFNQWWLDNGHTLCPVAPSSVLSGLAALEMSETINPILQRAMSNENLLLAEAICCAAQIIYPHNSCTRIENGVNLYHTIPEKYLEKNDIDSAKRWLDILCSGRIALTDGHLAEVASKLSVHYLRDNNVTKAQELAIKMDQHFPKHVCWLNIAAYYTEKELLTEAWRTIKTQCTGHMRDDRIHTLLLAYARKGDPKTAEMCRNDLMPKESDDYNLTSDIILSAYFNQKDLPNAERLFLEIPKIRHVYLMFAHALQDARNGYWTSFHIDHPLPRFSVQQTPRMDLVSQIGEHILTWNL